MTKIIAFSGRKQSGKSTSSEYVNKIMHEAGILCKVYSFADPLKKDICMNMLGLTFEQCYGTDDDKNTLTTIQWENIPGYDISWTYRQDYHTSGFMTARQVMEIIGTNIFRKIKNNVWVDATINKIKQENPEIAIITDCRFPNEVNSILFHNGYAIRLTLDIFKSHSDSECALDYDRYDWKNFSCIVDNSNMTEEEKNTNIKIFLRNKKLLPP